jgi:hypothetical protein
MSKAVYLGLDLGESFDYTAIAAIEAEGWGSDRVYQLRHLDRWRGIPYHEGVEKVRRVVDALDPDDRRWSRLVIDKTGVGAGPVELFRFAHPPFNIAIEPIFIHGGDRATQDEKDRATWRVPKRDLVAVVQIVLEAKPTRLRIAASLPHAKILHDELRNFKVTIDPVTAHDSYAAGRSGEHDDLVLSVALALWEAERNTTRHDPKVTLVNPNGSSAPTSSPSWSLGRSSRRLF